jgi:hypothetical protein
VLLSAYSDNLTSSTRPRHHESHGPKSRLLETVHGTINPSCWSPWAGRAARHQPSCHAPAHQERVDQNNSATTSMQAGFDSPMHNWQSTTLIMISMGLPVWVVLTTGTWCVWNTHVALLRRGRGADGTALLASLHLMTHNQRVKSTCSTGQTEQSGSRCFQSHNMRMQTGCR